MIRRIIVILILVVFVAPKGAFTHPGGTDGQGCHTVRTPGYWGGLYFPVGFYHRHYPITPCSYGGGSSSGGGGSSGFNDGGAGVILGVGGLIALGLAANQTAIVNHIKSAEDNQIVNDDRCPVHKLKIHKNQHDKKGENHTHRHCHMINKKWLSHEHEHPHNR